MSNKTAYLNLIPARVITLQLLGQIWREDLNLPQSIRTEIEVQMNDPRLTASTAEALLRKATRYHLVAAA